MTIDSEIDKKLAKRLHETIVGYDLRADGYEIAYDDDVMKALWAIAKHYCDQKLAQEANKARVDEIQKIVDWGKTIDDQWNAHFKERLKELRLTADKEQA